MQAGATSAVDRQVPRDGNAAQLPFTDKSGRVVPVRNAPHSSSYTSKRRVLLRVTLSEQTITLLE
jgi:hypothetical protein